MKKTSTEKNNNNKEKMNMKKGKWQQYAKGT